MSNTVNVTLPVPAVTPPAVTPPPVQPPSLTPPPKKLAVVLPDATYAATLSADGNTLTVTGGAAEPPVITGVVVSGPTSVAAGQSAQFAAVVQGTGGPSQSVTWGCSPGTITPNGMYTAPATAGAATVSATASDNTTKGSMPITVTAAVPPSGESVNGASVVPNKGQHIVDALGSIWTFQAGAATDPRGNIVLIGTKAAGAAILLVYENHAVYSNTASGAWWGPLDQTGNGPKASDPRPNPPNGGGVVPPTGTLAAFPGAQGGGALASGGRGGKVIEVTNTNSSGPGSLTDAVLQTGPRNIVFRISGIIPFPTLVQINSGDLSIFGQSAPGQIIIGGPKTLAGLRFSCANWILQYLTFSPDNPAVASGPDTGTLGVYGANANMERIVIDHCSNRWPGNKMCVFVCNSGFYRFITMQNCLNYEPHAMHPVGPSAFSLTAAINALCHDYDYHHNIFVNIGHRISEITHTTSRWTNNITFNRLLYGFLTLGATSWDILGSIWDQGNFKAGYPMPIYSTDGNYGQNTNLGTPSFHIDDCIFDGQSTPASDPYQFAHVAEAENVVSDLGPFPSAWKRSTPLAPGTPFPIIVEASTVFAANLYPHVGNSFHLDLNGQWVFHRDTADIRVITQVKTKGSGGFWPNAITEEGPPSIPTPTPAYTSQTPVAFTPYPSSQHDGLSDAWKQKMGLDTSKPQNAVVMPDGYTAIEWFMQGRKS